MDPYMLGYYIGTSIVDFVVLFSGSTVAITGYTIIKNIVADHILSDRSDDAISDNLFECLDFLE